jgi:hypothetical protein
MNSARNHLFKKNWEGKLKFFLLLFKIKFDIAKKVAGREKKFATKFSS